MTEYELNRLAELIVQKQAESQQWMTAFVAERMRQEGAGKAEDTNLVSAERAAKMLGISVGHLRRIKEHFRYVKGGSISSPLKFYADTLKEDYLRYTKSTNKSPVFYDPVMAMAK